MVKTKIVGSMSVDSEGIKKIGKSFVLTVASAAVVSLGDIFGIIDFGSYSNLAYIAVPFILNSLKKIILKYESK